MKALITGVTGFVGSHLAECLLHHGDLVLGTSRHGNWSPDVPSSVRDRVEVIGADMSAGFSEGIRDRIARFDPDVIYHLAAISVPGDCGADQPTFDAIVVNVEGTRAAVALAQSLPRAPRLVFASSCYVYGSISADHPVVNESSPCRPVHGYGITKLAAEQHLLHEAENGKLDAVVARSFQHAGPRQSPKMVLPDWARQLAADTSEPLNVICLDTFLDISDVRDVVQAYRALCVCGHSGIVYNVGSGVCRRAGDLLDWMRSYCSSAREVRELSPGRRQHPIADIGRILQHTSWRPSIPIAKTLEEILRYWHDKEHAT